MIQAQLTRQQVQAITFDIQSAYDTVWHEGLLEKIQRMGLEKYLINWTRSFLTDRQGVLEIGSVQHEASIACGVPQGSPLSPTLFLIYINDLLKSLEELSPVRFQAYANDLIIWVQGLFRDGFTYPMLTRALEMMTRWSHQWHLRFHPGKCCAICSHGAQVRVSKHFEAKLYDTIIPYTPELRCVGLWLDKQLTWRKHIREKTSRAMAWIHQLRRAVRTHWGPSCSSFLQLVHGAVIPLLFYGAEC